MSSTWDLYDSYNAMELSSLPTKQSMLESNTKASIVSKDHEPRVPGSTIEKSKISFISGFFFFLMECFMNLHVIPAWELC